MADPPRSSAAPAQLPTPRPPTYGDLVRFDLAHGVPAALTVLWRHLSVRQAAQALGHYATRLLRDPLADLPRTGWGPRREQLVRHQLRAAVRLDDALRSVSGLRAPERREVLRDVIAETGSRFIEANVPMPATETWVAASNADRARYANAVVARFFNADTSALDAGPRHFSFDVGACRFVQLCAALGRPSLAPLFCEADAVFFERPESPLRLVRTETLANGGARCDFRFRFRD
ncbi:MAG: L-2-amino-thiazoline-4-carboxylic acid hydrolase [Sandaracinaceae bacterium]